jgi:hypothetical protein
LTPASENPTERIKNFIAVFPMCRFSHGHACRMVIVVETRPPETAGSADRAGAIGGLAPALVASGTGLRPPSL